MELGNQWFLTYKPFEYREDERAPWLLRLINAPVRMVLGLVMNALASMYVLAVMPTFVKKVLMMLGFFITRLIPFIWMFVELCVYKIFRCFSETTVHTVFLIGILLIAMLVSKIIMFLAALMYCLVIFFHLCFSIFTKKNIHPEIRCSLKAIARYNFTYDFLFLYIQKYDFYNFLTILRSTFKEIYF